MTRRIQPDLIPADLRRLQPAKVVVEYDDGYIEEWHFVSRRAAEDYIHLLPLLQVEGDEDARRICGATLRESPSGLN